MIRTFFKRRFLKIYRTQTDYKLKDYIDVHVHRGANVLDLYNDIRNTNLSLYNTVIVHVGGNDASGRKDVQQFTHIYEDMIRYLKDSQCRVIVSGILPRWDCDVSEYDTSLMNLCMREDVQYVENYSSFVYRDGTISDDYYYRDGIHLNRTGTVKLLNNIHKVIKVFRGKAFVRHHHFDPRFHPNRENIGTRDRHSEHGHNSFRYYSNPQRADSRDSVFTRDDVHSMYNHR